MKRLVRGLIQRRDNICPLVPRLPARGKINCASLFLALTESSKKKHFASSPSPISILFPPRLPSIFRKEGHKLSGEREETGTKKRSLSNAYVHVVVNLCLTDQALGNRPLVRSPAPPFPAFCSIVWRHPGARSRPLPGMRARFSLLSIERGRQGRARPLDQTEKEGK